MSGCNHPINYDNSLKVTVSALQFNCVIGNEKARILVNDHAIFNAGDPIEVVEISVNNGKPTGRSVTRFVLYVESRVPLYSDDDYIVLHLVPARYMIDVLNKS